MVKILTGDAFWGIIPDLTLIQDQLEKAERRKLLADILGSLANKLINGGRFQSTYLNTIGFFAANFAILFDPEVASRYDLSRAELMDDEGDQYFFEYSGIQISYAELIRANAVESWRIKEITNEQYIFFSQLAEACLVEIEDSASEN